MKKIVFLGLVFVLMQNDLQAQLTRYIIQLKNKATSPFSLNNPAAFLSQKAIDKRIARNIALDSSDLPVTPRYIDSIRNAGSVTILNKSKWLNQVSIQTTDANAITKINNLPFVSSVSTIASRQINTPLSSDKFKLENVITPITTTQERNSNIQQDFFSYGNANNEIRLHNGQFLHNIGMRGQNMLIAVLDGGFFRYNNLPAFDSVNLNNQILQTWDFVANHATVAEDDSHGMSCLSTIAANIPGNFIGNAPKANFALYRTEDVASEYPIEEFNWVCAVERADSIGADVVTTSLGYTTFDDAAFNYSYSTMNGRTTIAAKGGTLAHRKGLLLFSAMGNDGNNSWRFLSTPADIDSTIAVGAVTSAGSVGSFSSYGPSFDGRVKPEASAVGVSALVQFSNGSVATGNGTSYACPKMAGLGTCLWQAFPEFNNYTIREAIIKSGSRYTNPNDRIGYGIPDMKTAFIVLLNKYAKITSATSTNCRTTLVWNSKDVSSMRYEIERKLPTQTNYTKIADIQGMGSILSNKNGVQFIDSTIANGTFGTIQYRIKQVIDTSLAGLSSTYFDSVNVVINAPCVVLGLNGGSGVTPTTINITHDRVVVMPTPVTTATVTIRVETVKPVAQLHIRIIDIEGRVLQQITQAKLAGRTDYKVDVSKLSKGTYTVSVYKENVLLDNGRLVKL